MLAILKQNPFLASCLLASLLGLIWKMNDRKGSWTPALLPVVWAFCSKFLLGVSALLLPVTLDSYLYTADSGFGFQPAFAGARLLLANSWLWRSAEVCYFNLPFGIALLYLLLRLKRGNQEASAFVRLAVVLGIAGYCVYFLFPAIGPLGAFGRNFPYGTPEVPLIPTAMPLIERNCMPSLHAAWIFAMLLSARTLSKRLQCILWVFSGLTLLYTLSGGGHYLVDLIVAIPFTLAVRYASRLEWRSPGFAANTVAVLLWLALLRFATNIVSLSLVMYPLTLGTLALAHASCRRRRRESCLTDGPATDRALLPSIGA